MAPKTSTFFDLKTCLGKSYRHSISPFSSLFTPFLPSSPSSHLVSHCHFVLGSSLSLASLYVLCQLSPFCVQPGHSVRLATSCYSMPLLFFLLLLFSLSAKRLISSDVSLDTQWMAVTFRATFLARPDS